MIPQELPEMITQGLLLIIGFSTFFLIVYVAKLLIDDYEDKSLFRELNRRTMIREVIDEEKTVLYEQIEQAIDNARNEILVELKRGLRRVKK